MIRAKARWIEDGEKNSKYFMNLEKRNYNNTCIKTLLTSQNIEISDTKSIIAEQKNYYENLYKTKIDSEIDDRVKK